MVEEGVVHSREGERIIVNIEKRAACGACRLCNKRETKEMQIELEDSIGAKPGDKVLLHIDDGVIVKGALLVYALPLVFLLVGLFIGIKLAYFMALQDYRELISSIVGFALMFGSFFAIEKLGVVNKDKFKPTITFSKE